MNLKYSILLDIIIDKIIPKTKISVNKGNKIFGAAILKREDLSLVCLGTNNETVNPLYHGEISTLINFYKIPQNIRPKENKCIFLSTHEPCSLCLSAITWSGFKNFYFFFPYQDTKKKFNIPHDLRILKNVFNIKNGQYIKSNSYWKSYHILNEIKKNRKKNIDSFKKKIDLIYEKYNELSKKYKKFKKNTNIPLK